MNWAEVGFRYKSNGAFCTFFFFFFFEFQPESSVSADSGQSWPNSARIGTSRSRVGANRLKTRGIHVARRGGMRGQQRPRRVAASDAGAAPLVPRPCFIVDHPLLHYPIACELWSLAFCLFGIHWVMPHKIIELFESLGRVSLGGIAT